MTADLHLVCLLLALVLFFLGAVLWPPAAEAFRLRLVSGGLFFWVLSLLVK